MNTPEKPEIPDPVSPDPDMAALDATLNDESRAAAGFGSTRSHGVPFEDVDVTPDLTRFGDSAPVPSEILADSRSSGPRYEIIGEMGKGGEGRIYSVHDRSLDRTIAVKFLRRSSEHSAGVKQHFIHEARVTAKLEHPNIMPVHDIGLTPHHEVFFSMKKISGVSLGDAIRAEKAGKPVSEEFHAIDGRVRIFLKVCDALTYAHHMGYIHQDVKPDNIMLGDFGEVLLLDWGSAFSKDEIARAAGTTVFGTPAYMSPEQARCEPSDERSDVYCLGATLLHALLLRHVIWGKDSEAFWEKKRAGLIDPVTDGERRSAPRALIDIALKALSADPSQRYQCVADFADELKRWQSGRAVRAHRESPAEIFIRWYRKNRRVFWVALLAAALVSGAGTLLFREKLQELLIWRPVYTDNFSRISTADISADWEAWAAIDWWTEPYRETMTDTGSWRIINGELQGFHGVLPWINICYRHPVTGGIRVEWDYTARLFGKDMNCYIAGRTRLDGYMLHVGGFGDAHSCKLTRGRGDQLLAEATLPWSVDTGVTYRYRLEKDDRHIRLFINGRRLVDYFDPVDISGVGHQTFGFETNNGNRISIANVRIYHHPLPLKVSPIASVKRLMELGMNGEALRQLNEIAEAYPGTPTAGAARFLTAQCLAGMDSLETAMRAYEHFEREHPRHELTPLSIYERARLFERRGDTASTGACWDAIARRFKGSPVVRTVLLDFLASRTTHMYQVSEQWVVDSSNDGSDQRWVEREAARFRKLEADLGIFLEPCPFMGYAFTLLANYGGYSFAEAVAMFPLQTAEHAAFTQIAGRWEEVVRRYPGVGSQVSQALLNLGEYQDVLDRCPNERQQVQSALLALGRSREALAYSDFKPGYWKAFAQLGRFDTLMNQVTEFEDSSALFAYRLGKMPQYLSRRTAAGDTPFKSLAFVMNRPDTALPLFGSPSPASLQEFALYYRILTAAGMADSVVARRRLSRDAPISIGEALNRLGRSDEAAALLPKIPDMVLFILNEKGEFDTVLQRAGDRPPAAGITALLCLGRDRQVLDSFPRRRILGASILLNQGRFEDIVRRYPDQRLQAAHALLELGRHDELARAYPEQRDLQALALYRQGKPDSALKAYPETRDFCARHLLGKGEFDSVVRRFPDQVWEYSLALTALRRYGEIPVTSGFLRVNLSQRCDLAHLREIQEWNDHGGGSRTQTPAGTHPFYYTGEWYALRFGEFFLGPVLVGLGGDTASMRARCIDVMHKHPFHFGRLLWHEAAWLAGSIDDTAFLAQPYRRGAQQRLTFLKAVRSDIRGDRQSALDGYRACMPFLQQHPEPSDAAVKMQSSIFTSETVKQFINLRMKELGM